MGKKVGIGVIGCGSVAEIAHFPSIRDIAEAELIATCDINEETARKAAEKWKVKAWYTDYRKMLERKDLDAVIVATPNSFHHEQVLAAAEAKVNVIVEKPMACTNKEAWEMVDACKKAKVKLMVGCNYRFWLQHEIGKELIEQGLLGKIMLGEACLHEGWNLYPETVAATKFRSVPEEAGAGAIFDLGSHKVDLLRWFMGSEVKRVVGIAKRSVTPEDYTTLDDVFCILLEFENGACGRVSGDRYSSVVTHRTELFGTEGTMYLTSECSNPFQSAPLAIYTDKDYNWDDLPGVIRDYRYPIFFWAEDVIKKPVYKRWVSIYPPRKWSYTRMINHFIQCIFEDKQPLIKGEDGAKAMDILCAVFKSMKTGGWVDLPLKEEITPPHYQPRRGGG